MALSGHARTPWRYRPSQGSQLDAGKVQRRALVAGCIGNLVEWYDFALYGAFATAVAVTFFPGPQPAGQLVATFGVFAIAFLVRPLGALVFAHFGDRLGRRRALATGILLMALATTSIGSLPGYATIGWPAPVLLAVLRVVQGVAVGGEYGGSAAFVVEYAPSDRRGWYGGWQWSTIGLGLAAGIGVGAALSALLPTSALQVWGWRLPFLLALPLGVTGLYVRARLGETPAFRAARRAGVISRVPLADAMRIARREVIIGFWIVAAVAATFNVFYVFLPNALAAREVAPLSTALGTALVGLVFGSISAPAFGILSDLIGRRPLLIGGLTFLLVAIAPALWLIQRGDTSGMLAGYVLIGMPLGSLTLSAFLAESFPTPVRHSGLSLTYGVASAVFGGTAPIIAAVMSRGGDLSLPMSFVMVLTAVAVGCAFAAPETVQRQLHPDT